MSLYFHIDPPHRWVQTDRQGRPRQSGESLDLGDLPAPEHGGRVAVVPGETVLTRRVEVPARNRARLLAALPYALEDDLAEDVEALHFALFRWRPGAPATVAVVSRAHMDDWVGRLAGAGLAADALVPDYLLLPRHPQAAHTLARERRGLLVTRGPELTGATFEEDLLEAWWNELSRGDPPVAASDADLARRLVDLGAGRVSEWRLGQDLADWLDKGPQAQPAAQLLQGDYAPRRPETSRRPWQAAAALALAALLVHSAVDAYEYVWLKRREARLEAEIAALARRALPPDSRLVNPRLQVQRRLAALGAAAGEGGGELGPYLAALARGLPNTRARLEALEWRAGTLQVRVVVPDFASLERLRDQLGRQRGMHPVLLGSSARDGKVTASLRLGGGGA